MDNNFTDKKLTCRTCGKEFDFTAGQQEFFAKNNFTEPKECSPECRATRKAEIAKRRQEQDRKAA